ncbi:MAG: hypothetical protein JRI23_24125 [Deltaproteobacteria bacterium]|jgi:hypothetical protein|nr:hypothetical protein [Deltaproteobacteria bacterium]MBW2535085.1 hypothetical protein [Deltaproteobacteria bacterium]
MLGTIMAAEPIEKVRQRFRHARARTAEQEAALGEKSFLLLPARLQNQLAVLQAQCEEPVVDDQEALVAAEHNLKGYNAKLTQALDLSNQLAGARQRRGSDQAQGLKRLVVWLLVLGALVAGGWYAHGYVTAKKSELCATSASCLEDGKCGGGVRIDPPTVELTCVAETDEHCRSSARCSKRGQCYAEVGSCVARDDADCRQAPGCKLDGLCTAEGGSCRATKREDCRATPRCMERGECTAKRGVCTVGNDEDCKHSLACKKHGACTELQGNCVKTEM